eukprot:1816426-Prymnesium_polylepis.3
MRGGIQDYDDSSLRQWTVDHPDKDWLPLDFVTTVDKRFLFTPGKGGSYSGVSYVLMGWVLCAATGCSEWSDLRQAELIEQGSDFKFDAARFMGGGPCSQYDGLVHQCAAITLPPVPARLESPRDSSPPAAPSSPRAAVPCSSPTRRSAAACAAFTPARGRAQTARAQDRPAAVGAALCSR